MNTHGKSNNKIVISFTLITLFSVGVAYYYFEYYKSESQLLIENIHRISFDEHHSGASLVGAIMKPTENLKDSLKNKGIEINDSVRKLEFIIEAKNFYITTLSEQYEREKKYNEVLVRSNQELIFKYDSIKIIKDLMQDTINNLTILNEQLKNEITQLEEKVKVLEQEIDNLKNQLANYITELNKANNLIHKASYAVQSAHIFNLKKKKREAANMLQQSLQIYQQISNELNSEIFDEIKERIASDIHQLNFG